MTSDERTQIRERLAAARPAAAAGDPWARAYVRDVSDLLEAVAPSGSREAPTKGAPEPEGPRVEALLQFARTADQIPPRVLRLAHRALEIGETAWPSCKGGVVREVTVRGHRLLAIDDELRAARFERRHGSRPTWVWIPEKAG